MKSNTEIANNLKAFVDSVINQCNFLQKEDQHLFESAKSALLFLWERDNNPHFLIRLCVLYVKRYKRATPEVLEYSRMAVQRSSHPDAVVYFGKSLVINSEPDEAITKIEELKREMVNSSNDILMLLDIFKACAYYKKGDYRQFINLISDFNEKKSESFKPYISIPVATIFSDDLSLNSVVPESSSIVGKVTTKIHSEANPSYVISVSCDSNYFELYGKFFIESLARINENFYCHISITDNINYVSEDSRFVIVNQNLNLENNLGPVSSCLRFVHARELLSAFGCPIVVLDFDCVFKTSIKPLIDKANGFHCGLRILGNVLPWEKYTGGMSIWFDNEYCKNVLENVYKFLSIKLKDDTPQWWIDQNALEAAFRLIVNDEKFQVFDAFKEIPKYMHIPTGSVEGKLQQLSSVVDSLH